MKKTIKIGMFGLGRAGKEVAEQFVNDTTVELCWVIRENNSTIAGELPDKVSVYGSLGLNLEGLLEESPVDFVVDFSIADSCLAYADILSTRNIGIISAVSAYEEHHLARLGQASKKTIVLYSPNITLGINFIIIAGQVLRKLAPHAGVEVIEEHFHNKKEVSGTAIKIAELLELDPEKQVNSIRVGGIVGRHEIIFGFPNQTVRLTHDSINRAAFGQGALYAIKNLYGRQPGFYTMEQLVSEGFRNALV